MIERLIVLGVFAFLLIVLMTVARGWRRWQERRLREEPGVEVLPAGRPGVVAFSTENCVQCRTRQAPALTRLRETLNERINIRTLSALEHRDLVEQWGILTVPATVVLDASGTVQHLNLGFASDQKLRQQLEPLLETGAVNSQG
ncbi:MAG: thioredoxin family protein [Chloroflexota bacterium]|nr:thioredoxin family protein [Chloroflexota bacterium]